MNASWFVISVLGLTWVRFTEHFEDPDAFWFSWVGSRFLTTGRFPNVLGNHAFAAASSLFIPQEWLYGIMLTIFPGGWQLVVLRLTFAIALMFALSFSARRALMRGADPIATAFSTMFAGLACCTSYGTRPQVVGWLFFSLELYVIELDGAALWWIVPITIAWVNVHASGVVAPVFLGLAALGAVIDDRGFSMRARRRLLVSAVSTLGLAINPFGWQIVAFTIGLANHPMRQYVVEWRPPSLYDPLFTFGGLQLLLIVAARGLQRGRPGNFATDAMLFATTLTMMLSARRHEAFFALAALPMAATALNTTGIYAAAIPESLRKFGARVSRFVPAAGLTFAIAGGLYWTSIVTQRVRDYEFAPELMGRVVAMNRPLRLFCSDFSNCSYAIGSDRVRVFNDGRNDSYSGENWRAWRAIGYVEPSVATVLKRYDIDSIVVQRDEPLEQYLAYSGGWRQSVHEPCHALWLRDPSAKPDPSITPARLFSISVEHPLIPCKR